MNDYLMARLLASPLNARVSGELTHTFAKGTGEEFRGYKADAALALEHYAAAVNLLEGLLETYAAPIKAEKDALMAQHAVAQADHEAALEARREKIRANIAAAKAVGKRLFSDRYIREDELFALEHHLDNVGRFDSIPSSWHRYRYLTAPSATDALASAKAQLAIARVCTGDMYLSRDDAQLLGRMVDGSWAAGWVKCFETAYGDKA